MGGVQRTTTSRASSARKAAKSVWWVTVGWSAGAELEGEGVRCRMECSLREGVRAMKGMWKTLAERLGWGSVFDGGRDEERGSLNLPVAHDADVELLLGCHLRGCDAC